MIAWIAAIPVIVAFQVGLLFGLSFAVWLLLGEDVFYDKAEEGATREILAARGAAEKQEFALAGGPELGTDEVWLDAEALERAWSIPLCEPGFDYD